MNKNFTDDTLLARWLSGELTPSELEELQKHPHFDQFKSIAELGKNTTQVEYDIEAEWDQLKNLRTSSKESPKGKIRPFIAKPFSIALAACLILGLMMFAFWITSATTIEKTTLAETKTISLPDQSIVSLTPNSSIRYNKRNFNRKRKVKLKGQAFFTVQSQTNTFSVKSANLLVEVLGTSFDIIDNANYLNVDCYSGKVKVSHSSQSHIIEKNESVVVKSDRVKKASFTTSQSKPSWLNTNTPKIKFNDTPLDIVLDELERWYGIEIIHSLNLEQRKYTGGFTINDLDTALLLVCSPMFLTYSIDGRKVVIKSEGK